MSSGSGGETQTGPAQSDGGRSGTSSSQSPPPAQAASATPAGKTVPSTRMSAAWTTVAIGLVFLIALLIFIFQNLDDVKVTFLFFHGSVPLALSLLGAAIAGALAVLAIGVARMYQLRRVARRHRDAAVAARRSPSS
jgi:lipopolysaccharide assembly protein A